MGAVLGRKEAGDLGKEQWRTYHRFFLTYFPTISPSFPTKYATFSSRSSSCSSPRCPSTIVPGTIQIPHSLASSWYFLRYVSH